MLLLLGIKLGIEGVNQVYHETTKDAAKEETKRWRDRPVLWLLGMKLGIEGVNQVYNETIKVRFPRLFSVTTLTSIYSSSIRSPSRSASRAGDPHLHITLLALRATASSISTPTTHARRSPYAPFSASRSFLPRDVPRPPPPRHPAPMIAAPLVPKPTRAAGLIGAVGRSGLSSVPQPRARARRLHEP
jgi:hypothetical protein